jgi:hypothetical protein
MAGSASSSTGTSTVGSGTFVKHGEVSIPSGDHSYNLYIKRFDSGRIIQRFYFASGGSFRDRELEVWPNGEQGANTFLILWLCKYIDSGKTLDGVVRQAMIKAFESFANAAEFKKIIKRHLKDYSVLYKDDLTVEKVIEYVAPFTSWTVSPWVTKFSS